jgi:uncharacterized protein YceK
MKRTETITLCVLLLALTVVSIVALSGCGSSTSTTSSTSSTAPANNGAFPDGAAAEYYEETGQMIRSSATQKVSESDLGIPLYPGATIENGTAVVEVASCPVGVLDTTNAVITTQDTEAKVMEWYKNKMSSQPGFEDHSYTDAGSVHALYWIGSPDGSRQVIIEKNPSGSGTKVTAIVQKEKTK